MLRRAWRRLSAAPLFTLFAVVSLSVGIGVTTAVYAVILSITRLGLEVPAPDRVALLVGTGASDGRPTFHSLVSRADFEDLRVAVRAPIAASAGFYQTVGDAASELAVGEAVTGRYFAVLGLAPHLGRLLQPADDASPRVVVINYRFWRTRFTADPDVVGRTLRVGGEPFAIVGVAPPEFGGLSDRLLAVTDLWVPLTATSMFPSTAAPPADPADRRRRQLSVILAIDAGASIDALSAEFGAIGARLDAAWPIEVQYGEGRPQPQARSWSVRSVEAVVTAADRQLSLGAGVVMVIVGLVLVVACTNLANLVLARGASRLHELAVRRALGASRTRLVVEQLAESSLLAVLGAAGAIAVARVLIVWFTSARLPISEAIVVQLAPELNAASMALAAFALIAALIVFGLVPAIQMSRASLRPALATEGGSTGQLHWKTRRGLIAAQVAISVTFILIAAFAVRVVMHDDLRPSGIDLERLAVGRLHFGLPPWDEARARRAVERLVPLAAADPAFERVAVASALPFGLPGSPIAALSTTDRPFVSGRDPAASAPLIASTPSIFQTLGVPITDGRAFDERDTAGNVPVAVLSARVARQIFGTTDVVGREVLFGNYRNMADAATVKVLSVIGVASDTDVYRRHSRASGVIYVPLTQHYEPGLLLIARATRDPADLAGPMRALARQADPLLVPDRAGPAEAMVSGASVLLGVVARVAGGLALVALGLSMVGLFGVLSHVVSRRTREMGLRLALGAQPSQIRRLVIGDGLRPVARGLVTGLLIGAGVRTLLGTQAGSPWALADLVVFAAAPVPILIAAVLACVWPARRAARVHPNVALRDL
jgi:predicted permease